MTPLLDTYTWVWWVDQDRRLGAAAIEKLDRLPPDQRPFLSDISLWEVATLVERGRLKLDVPLREWLDAAAHPRSVCLVSITPAIAADLKSRRLRSTAIQPIASSSPPAEYLRLPLVTRDTRITRSRLVKGWKPSD